MGIANKISSPRVDQNGLDAESVRFVDLARMWHSVRAAAATAALMSGLLLGVAWRWPAALVVAGLATLVLLDALQRHRASTGSQVPSMLLDTTVIGVGMVVGGLEPVALGAPLLYMLAVAVTLLPWRRAVPVIVYSVAWAAVAFVGVDVMPPPIAVVDEAVTAIVYVIFGGHTLALLGGVARELERSQLDHKVRLRYQRALAGCGQALLASMEEGAIDAALDALLEAAPAQNIFVDENFEDPDLGLCSRVTHEVIRPGFEDLVDEEIWVEDDTGIVSTTVLAYADMPRSYAALSTGKAAVLIASELEGEERAIYEEDGCKSELNIPIMVAGEWVGSIGFAEYITDRVWSDDDLQVLHTAAAMVGAFWERNRSYQRLEELIRSKDEFLASISHEIRTPLTAVLGFSSVLQRASSQLTGEAASYVGLITEQAQEVADIVEDLLVAARADINALAVVPKPIDLREDTDKVVAARAAQVSHTIRVDGSEVVAWADPTRVRQIIRCLLSNAIRYGGDHIEIHIGEHNHRATLAVIDNGEGVPPDQEEHVFAAFHRAHSRDGLPEAMGLGLYVARHLARLMDGDLSHHRSDGHTKFELDLPLSQSAGVCW